MPTADIAIEISESQDGFPSTKPRTKYPYATRPKIAEDARARLIDGNRAAKKPPLGSRRTSGLEDGRSGAHSREMSEIPKFFKNDQGWSLGRGYNYRTWSRFLCRKFCD